MARADVGPRPSDEAFSLYWKQRDGATPKSPIWMARAAIDLGRSFGPMYRVWTASPRLTVQVSSSLSGRFVASRLAYRLAGRWVARPLLSVLEVPESIEGYIAGPPGKSRRLNLNRAKTFGITHAALPGGRRANEIYAHCNNERDLAADGIDKAVAAPGTISIMAVDKDGEPVAVGIAVVDRQEAYLSHLVAISGRDETLPARWLVHTEILRQLINQDVHRLWSEGPLVATKGNQTFQLRLGYVLARARVIETP